MAETSLNNTFKIWYDPFVSLSEFLHREAQTLTLTLFSIFPFKPFINLIQPSFFIELDLVQPSNNQQ
jgi:hypothetical protein